MLEKIIVINDVNNLANTLAYHGLGIFNTRIISPFELAEISLLRNGLINDKRLITKAEELAVLNRALDNNEYFKNIRYNDLKKISDSVKLLRNEVIENELSSLKDILSKGIFKEKNDALYKIIETYINYLNDNNLIDVTGYIRLVKDYNLNLNADIYLINEFSLTKLEEELVKTVSKNSYKKISLNELFQKDNSDIDYESIKNCYGAGNEAETVISSIIENKYPLDECVVAMADNTYSQKFYELSIKHNLNISFGNGIPISNSYPAKLLKVYFNWSKTENFSKESFLALINSPYLNINKIKTDLSEYDDILTAKFFDTVSDLRLTNNHEINKNRLLNYKEAIKRDIFDNEILRLFVKDIEYISDILVKPVSEFIDEYAMCRSSFKEAKLDTSAKETIKKEIDASLNAGFEIEEDIINNILKKNVAKETLNPGSLYITSIAGALTSFRKNLYVIGLAASTYPGSPKENPIILDSDLADFNNSNKTSAGLIEDKKNKLFSLVRTATGLNNKIYLSYSGLNVSELKNNNASSLLFDLYKNKEGFDKSLDEFKKTVIKVGYFDNVLSKTKLIGESYNKGITIEIQKEPINEDNTVSSKYYFSPSALSRFFKCEKSFLYGSILRIPEPADDDLYKVLPANKMGSLVHSMMEYLGKNHLEKEEFLKLSSEVFDEYMQIQVPLIEADIEKEKAEFLNMISNGYDMDNEYDHSLAIAEEDIKTRHPSGITVNGFPDSVILKNNKHIVVDFKTGRTIEHFEDDPLSCFQALIYAYILKKERGYDIDHVEYRYLRLNEIVSCVYNDEIEKELDSLLNDVKTAIDRGSFNTPQLTKNEEKEKCRYCKYGSICGKVVANDE